MTGRPRSEPPTEPDRLREFGRRGANLLELTDGCPRPVPCERSAVAQIERERTGAEVLDLEGDYILTVQQTFFPDASPAIDAVEVTLDVLDPEAFVSP